MAEDVEEVEKAGEDEAEALERLLMEEGAALPELPEEGVGAKVKGKKGLLIGGGVVLLLLLGGGVFWMMSSGESEEEAEPVPVVEPEKEPEVEIEKVIPHFYTLKPFFLPLKENGMETGQFINVEINLLLSNNKLGEEVENVLPQVRETIYQILERKRPRDFNNPKKPIEDRLKSEIITSTNTLLVSGSGKIEDVLFTELIVR